MARKGKLVELNNYEVQVITDCLDFHKLCEAGCYCEYKAVENFCNIMNEEGNYKCKFQQAILNIQKKLGVYDE